MMRRSNRLARRALCTGVAMFAFSAGVAAQPADDKSASIESLLKAGWQVADYTSASNNRAFILFKHATETYLVQCLAGYDVTRNPRVYSHCYELR